MVAMMREVARRHDGAEGGGARLSRRAAEAAAQAAAAARGRPGDHRGGPQAAAEHHGAQWDLCGGSICIDVNKVIDRLPPPEHVATIVFGDAGLRRPRVQHGRQPRPSWRGFPLGPSRVIGDDEYGRLAQEICARHSIGRSGLAVLPGQRTAYTDVMIEQSTGRRTFFYQPGVAALLAPEPLRPLRHAGEDLPLRGAGRARADGSGDRARQRLFGSAGEAKELGLRTNMELVCVAPSGSAR